LKKITIAIDGFSSTGKSTLAKQLAKVLGYIYVDTGAMYRAIALYALKNDCIIDGNLSTQKLVNELPKIQLRFEFNPSLGYAEIYLNDENVETNIRSLVVSEWVSQVAEISAVRAKLVAQQKQLGKSKGVVMDGRDIGTVVFPDAELKIFMTASAKTRAERRYNEMISKGQNITFEAVLENVERRDYLDTHREDSPLVQAIDAIFIDNSEMTQEDQLELAITLYKRVVTLEK
jgi:cytidylate kinase